MLLEQNFLRYEGAGEIPSQIHSYLSTQFKELRNLPKDHPQLRHKAKDRWYLPDPKKNIDVEKLRTKRLCQAVGVPTSPFVVLREAQDLDTAVDTQCRTLTADVAVQRRRARVSYRTGDCVEWFE